MRRFHHPTAAVLTLFLGAIPVHAEADHGGRGQGETFSAGEPGDPKKPARIIQVAMTEADGKMLFAPTEIEIKRDEQVKFMLRNSGELDHELVLATTGENPKHAEGMRRNPDMEHDDPNARRLAPKNTGEMAWKFSKTGEFEYSCLIPGHREAGMIGTIVVK